MLREVAGAARKAYQPVKRRMEAYLDRTSTDYIARARGFLASRGPIPPEDNSWSRLFTLRGQLEKRAVDMGVAFLGMFVLFPAAAVVAPLIKLSSRGPVIFAKEREGLGGNPVLIYKFRTMRVGAERQWLRYFRPEFVSWKPDEDERTISIGDFELGRIMRKYAIDELPQLAMLFTGKMNFVGVRGRLTHELDAVGNPYNWRDHRRKLPLGLVPVSLVLKGGYPSNRELAELEMFYIANWSLALDFKIALRGLVVLAAGRHK